MVRRIRTDASARTRTTIGRALLDWRLVFAEFAVSDPATLAAAMAFSLVVFGAWIIALPAAARGERAGALVALGLTLFMDIARGLATTFVFCPTPYPTAWPLGELRNWTGTLVGAGATVVLVRDLRAPRRASVAAR